MHILEIPSFFPPYGGLFCLDQARALAALGHEVRILSNVQLGMTVGLRDYLLLPWRRYEHQMEGLTVIQSYQRGLPRLIRHNARRWVGIVRGMFADYVGRYGCPDVLHAHCAKWAGYAAMRIGERYRLPYVITEHLPLMLLEEEYGPAPSGAWQIPLLRQAYGRAAMVVPVAEELVDATACYYGSDYRWRYLSNTIDTGFFAYRPRRPLGGRVFRFCSLADYYYRKGYDVLFSALRRLQDQGVEVELHIAGFLTDSKACREEIERMGLRRVRAYGRLDKQGVRRLLYDCDALVLASRSEVQPLVLLEAMSTGIPVVSTECIPRNLRLEGGCTIVAIGDDGALADAMLQVTTHPLSDQEAVLLSERVAALASPQVVGRQLESIFREAIASR